MKTIAPALRRKVNQLAHSHALRIEFETRDRWLADLTEALEAGATLAELQERIAKLGSW